MSLEQGSNVIADSREWLPKETDTREVYTAALVNRELPTGGNQTYVRMCKNQQELLQLLYDDPVMEPNRQQPYNVKANRRSRVYDLWGFVSRTIYMALQLDPDNLPAQRGLASDVMGRMTLSMMMVLHPDMQKDAYPIAEQVEFSEAIKAKAAELDSIIPPASNS